MLNKCDNCGAILISAAIKNESGEFCSKKCFDWHSNPEFCDKCCEITSPKSAGSTYTINGIGTKLYGKSKECPTCKSVQKSLWFCLLFIPIIPISKYRVKYVNSDEFISRKLS